MTPTRSQTSTPGHMGGMPLSLESLFVLIPQVPLPQFLLGFSIVSPHFNFGTKHIKNEQKGQLTLLHSGSTLSEPVQWNIKNRSDYEYLNQQHTI